MNTPPTGPRTPLQTLRAIIPWWYLLVFAPWAYLGFYYLLVPETTYFSSTTGSFALTMFAFATIAILAIGFTGNYIRLKRGRPLPPPRFYFLPRPFLILIALPVVALIYFTIQTTPPTYSQPSPWQDQLNLANQEAARVDKDPILTNVTADEICCRTSHITADSTLEVEFTYMRSSGKFMKVTIYDTNPPRLKEVETETYRGAGDAQLIARLTRQTDDLRISPRQALRAALTAPGAPALPTARLDTIIITLYLQEALEGTGLSRNWYISYFTDEKPNSNGMRTFLLDPTDGHLVELRVH